MTIFNGALTDGVTAGQVGAVTYAQGAAETFKTLSFANVIRSQPALLQETVVLTPLVSSLTGLVLVEKIGLSLSQIPNHHFNLVMAEVAQISAALISGVPAALADSMAVTVAAQAQAVTTLIDALGLTSMLTPALVYSRSFADSILLADMLAQFFGGALVDAFTVSEVFSGSALMPDTLSDGLALTEAATPTMLLRVIAQDTVSVSPIEALKMLYDGQLSEAIEITPAYLSPGNSVTTWAMNTRTAGVTEYTNYAFNSFALNRDKYLGATADGLYELVGDDDAGTSIIADIKSGFAQWSGTHMGSFKGAYLACRGGGQFVLKVTTGDGKEYDYTVTTDSMKTAKINMGKGLRARYFAFELISSGQDFDLDTLEFIPLIAKRRV